MGPKHLNIPLSRHTRTTRQPKRVVWLLPLVLITSFFIFGMGVRWFTGPSILSSAPAQTEMAIQLSLTEKTLPLFNDWLTSVPLISNRSIELSDILPYTRGEIALFVHENGKRSIAIRANKEEIPNELFKNFGVSVQNNGPFVILSENLVPISGLSNAPHRPFFPSFKRNWIGRIAMPANNLFGDIFTSNKHLFIRIKTKNEELANETIASESADVFLENISWNESIPLQNIRYLLSQFYNDEGNHQSFLLSEDISVDILLQNNTEQSGVVLFIKEIDLSEQQLIKELQILGALSQPTIETKQLEDGTVLEEIIIDPDRISIEEFSWSKGSGYRVAVPNQSLVASFYSDGIILSTNEALLDQVFVQNIEISDSTTCSTSVNTNKIAPNALISDVSSTYQHPQLAFLNSFFHKFPFIFVEYSKQSINLTFCSI